MFGIRGTAERSEAKTTPSVLPKKESKTEGFSIKGLERSFR
jgi:hypothetical protein